MENIELKEVGDFPEWAVPFAMYYDETDLTEDERTEVGYWMADNQLSRIVDVGDDSHFSKSPIFGKACNVVTAYFEPMHGV